MRRIKAAVMILGVAGSALTAAAVPLPHSEGFDGVARGTNFISAGWSYSGVSAAVSNNAGLVTDSTSNVLYTTESAALAVSAVGKSNVWFLGDAVMSAFPALDPDPEIGDAAAAFFLNTDGAVKAYSNGAFVVVKTGLDTNKWVGFAVQLDYASSKWNLYLRSQADANGGDFNLANTNGPLAFRTGYTGTSVTNIEVSGITYLNAVELLAGAGLVTADSPNTITPRTVNYSNTNQWYASRVADKTYSGGESNLAGQLGADLAAGLVAGDKLRVHTEDGWQVYVLAANGKWVEQSILYTPPNEVTMTAGLPVWFQVASAVSNRFSLYDLDWTPAELASQAAEPLALTINPSTSASGWTALVWDSASTKTIHPLNQVGFPTNGLTATSAVFVVNSNGQYVRGFWTGSNWFTQGNQPITVRPGNIVWVYNTGDGKTWTVDY
jgi:hypothetical protein